MTEIKCGWSACKWNTSFERGEMGYCNKEKVELEFIEVFNDFGEEEDGLQCVDYKNGNKDY